MMLHIAYPYTETWCPHVFVMLRSLHVKLDLTEHSSIFSYTVCAAVMFYSFKVVMNNCCNALICSF